MRFYIAAGFRNGEAAECVCKSCSIFKISLVQGNCLILVVILVVAIEQQMSKGGREDVIVYRSCRSLILRARYSFRMSFKCEVLRFSFQTSA